MKTVVAIIGGGSAGPCAALDLERHVIESTIVEKVPFPRYHIGELKPDSIPSGAGP